MKLNMSLDPSSIEKAIKKLEEYRKKGLQKKIDRTIGDVANRIIEVAYRHYSTTYRESLLADVRQLSPSVSFTITRPNKQNWIISAFTLAGDENISFLEFGAGNLTESDAAHSYLSQAQSFYPKGIRPGSYSEDHAGTYQRWLNGDRSVMQKDGHTYIFDRAPKRGLWYGMEAGRRYLHNMSVRVKA